MKFAYISDIHIEFVYRNLKRRKIDILPSAYAIADIFIDNFKYLQSIQECNNQATIDAVLIAGDISHCFEDAHKFLQRLDQNLGVPVYVCLGNHDVWNWTSSISGDVPYYLGSHYFLMEEQHADAFGAYQNVHLLKTGMKLDISKPNEHVSIIGDMGYAGLNRTWGADQGLYRTALTDKYTEIERSAEWREFYNKCLAERKPDETLIVLTHMPIEDWTGRHNPDESGYIHYVNGHTHGEYGYRTSDTYHDDAQNGYETTSFRFGTFETRQFERELERLRLDEEDPQR